MSGKTLKTASTVDLLTEVMCRRVKNPKNVEVKNLGTERNKDLEIEVNEKNIGLVIGGKGYFIKAVRAIFMNLRDPNNPNEQIHGVSVLTSDKSKGKPEKK